MESGRSLLEGGLEAEVSREVVSAPPAVFLGAGKDADAGFVENGAVDSTESVFHAGFNRAFHLATALFPKLGVLGFLHEFGVVGAHFRRK